MGIESRKSYTIVCDDGCKKVSLLFPDKQKLIEETKKDGWAKRGNKYYCPTCALNHPPLKRGRKPKPKVEATPAEAKPVEPVWNSSGQEIWSPEAE